MTRASTVANRTLTIIAAGFLAFDGACLIFAGLMLGRALVVIIGACLLLSSGLVFVYWRRHRRQADEIADARLALGEQAKAFRDIIRRN